MSILHCPASLIAVENAPRVYELEKANVDSGKFRVDAEYVSAEVKTHDTPLGVSAPFDLMRLYQFIQGGYINEAGDAIETFGPSPYTKDDTGLPFSMTTKDSFSAHFVFQKGRFEADGKTSGMKPFICQTCAELPDLPEPGLPC